MKKVLTSAAFALAAVATLSLVSCGENKTETTTTSTEMAADSTTMVTEPMAADTMAAPMAGDTTAKMDATKMESTTTTTTTEEKM